MAFKEIKKPLVEPQEEKAPETPVPETPVPETPQQEEDVLDAFAIPYVESESESVTETSEKTAENEVVTKTNVTFKFNKNVRLGKVRLNKGDCIEIDSEDANLFVQQRHGEIVQ